MDEQIVLSNEDLDWIKTNQPHILHLKKNGVDILKGSLIIDVLFKKDHLLLYPSQTEIDKSATTYIFDQFNISMLFIKPTVYEIAFVQETGGRLEKTAKKKSLPLIDLHIMGTSDKRLCLHGQYDLDDCLPNGFNLKDYICNIIIPFFFSQSFFERYNKWPLGEYSHREVGKLQSFINKKSPEIIRSYFSNEEKRIKNFLNHLTKRNKSYKYKHKCPCGSKEKVKICSCGFKKLLDSYLYIKFFKEFRKTFPFKTAPNKFNIRKKNRYNKPIPTYLL